ncbi:hypothetical protein A0128_01725 [Leptospira tipperaryensis]|uniref:Uncharacterized protein n=1 Tax=Leptospira tipperaryensis TaxID=2564040 RepID=A0A1D7USV5_9LEPT|nr:hypothetical protein [Leptospira tipperaryensis]AOP32699.1 hypothetical protein A0128_01725 [Leptospira tipperaryensis]
MVTKSIPLFISAFALLSSGLLLFLILNFFYKRSKMISFEKRKNIYIPIFAILLLLLLQGALAFRGFFLYFGLPPRLLIGVVTTFVIFLSFGFSSRVFPILKEFGSLRLCLFQVWRILPEVLIFLLVRDGLLSEIMTAKGQNFDLWVPLSAPILYFAITRNLLSIRWLLLWNVIAIFVLGLTVFTGIMSAPFPFRIFFTDPPNEIVTRFPITYLPLLMVPLAFTLHVLGIAIGWKEWKEKEF